MWNLELFQPFFLPINQLINQQINHLVHQVTTFDLHLPEEQQNHHSDGQEEQGGAVANGVDQLHRGKV